MYNTRKGVKKMKKLMLVLMVVMVASFLFVGCLSVVPDEPVVVEEEEEETIIVNEEIHKIEIEADGILPVLVGESITLIVHAYNWPEKEEVQLDTDDIITWSENCDEDVLDPLVGLSTTFIAEEVGEYQISACYEWPEVEGCPFPQYLCTGITIYVTEE